MILYVDPDDSFREQIATMLTEAGFETATRGSLAGAREALADPATIDCLITEYELPDGSGLELVQRTRETTPDTACLVFTDVPLDDIDTAAFGDLVVEYLSKDDPDPKAGLVDFVENSFVFRSQTAYPLPEDEDARLTALAQYAADPAALGDSFDRLTELATELFGRNAAAVGLVDAHEQRFLSCYGVSFDPIDREDTVCTYAMLDDGVTVIEDVQDDARFSENEGLAAADIRFYASAPLVTPDGQEIGTFCVYDDHPSSFSDRERELLVLLAEEAMEELVLRRRLREGDGGDSDE